MPETDTPHCIDRKEVESGTRPLPLSSGGSVGMQDMQAELEPGNWASSQPAVPCLASHSRKAQPQLEPVPNTRMPKYASSKRWFRA